MMTHLSLFSGIGGIDLAAEWAGFKTVGQVEFADYQTKVLERHWPDVPRWRDIRDVTKESFFERTGRTTVELVSGGYPCQTFSVAGKRTGDLDLAMQFIRVISELRPNWVIGENVAGHITNGLDDVLKHLEQENYAARPFVLQASSVGAPHKRERVFIVAYSMSPRQEKRNISPEPEKSGLSSWMGYAKLAYPSKKPNAQTDPLFVAIRSEFNSWYSSSWSSWSKKSEPDWTVSKSELGRMADGISNGLDALGALGNAVVPQQVYPILKAISIIAGELYGRDSKI